MLTVHLTVENLQDKYEKPTDGRRPGELPMGLRAVGMGLGNNGQPLTNVDQLINSIVTPSGKGEPRDF